MKSANLKTSILCVALVAAVFTGSVAYSQSLQPLPSVKFSTASMVEPNSVIDNAMAATAITRAVCNDGTLATGDPAICTPGLQAIEIKELARGLGAGVLEVNTFVSNAFNFVHNNIQLTPTFGLQKGALGALRDRYGTSFDQANLLVEILREDSRLTNVKYQLGKLQINQSQAQSWYGPTSAREFCRLMSYGGIPVSFASTSDCDTLAETSAPFNATIAHVWVTANGPSATTFTLDPSLKEHAVISPGYVDLNNANLAQALDYDAADFYDNATDGMDPESYGVDDLSRKNLLTDYVYNHKALVDLVNGKPNLKEGRLKDLLGGRQLNPQFPGDSIPSRSYVTATSTLTTIPPLSDIPDALRTKVAITIGSNVVNTFADEISARTLWIRHTNEDAAGATATKGLFLDDVLLKTLSGVADIKVDINHPYAADSGAYMDRAITKNLGSGPRGADGDNFNNLNIVISFGDSAKSRPDEDRLKFARAVLPKELQTEMGKLRHRLARTLVESEWLMQTTQLRHLYLPITNTHIVHHHSVGFVNNNLTYHHIDVDTSLSLLAASSIDLSGQGALEQAVKVSYSAFSAGLEGFNIANAAGSGRNYSTPFVFHSQAAFEDEGDFLDLVGSDWATFNEFGVPIAGPAQGVVENYSTGAKQRINDYIRQNFRVIATQKGELTLFEGPNSLLGETQEEKRVAFLAISANGNEIAHMVDADRDGTQFIKGGAADGSAGGSITAADFFNPSLRNTPRTNIGSGLSVDPITGQPTIRQTDLVVGNGPFPYSLPYTRSYSPSDRLNAAVPMAGGWKHNYDLRLNPTSDPSVALGIGDDVPAATAIDFIAAIYISTDILRDGLTLPRILIAEILSTLPVQRIGQNTVVAETFDGPVRMFASQRLIDFQSNTAIYYPDFLPQRGRIDRLAIGDRTPALDTAAAYPDSTEYTLLTKEGVTYYYIVHPSRLVLDLGSLGITSIPLTCGAGTPIASSGGLMQAQWPSGVNVSIKWRDGYGYNGPDCHTPIEYVKNNLGRRLDFSERDSSGAMTVSGGGNAVKVAPTEITLPTHYANGGQKVIRYEFEGPSATTFALGMSLPLGGSRLKRIYLPNDPVNPFTTIEYDSLYRVKTVQESTAPYPDYMPQTVSYAFGSTYGQSVVAYIKNGANEIQQSYFDDAGRIVRSIDGENYATDYRYNSFGLRARETKPEKNYTTFQYDARYNLTTHTRYPKPPAAGQTAPDPISTSATYQVKCTVTLPALGPIDACDSPIQTVDELGRQTDYSYHSNAMLASRQEPCPDPQNCSVRPVTVYNYNGFGQPTNSTDPLGMLTEYFYNAENYLSVQVVDAGVGRLKLKTVNYYDAAGNKCKSVDPRGTSSLNGYEGNACSEALPAPAESFATSYFYTANRQIWKTNAPLGQITEVTYDDNGQQSIVDTFDNNDHLSRTYTAHYPNGKPSYVFNAECFDGPNALPQQQRVDCGRTYKQYDAAGRLKTTIDPDGRIIQNDYTKRGELKAVKSGTPNSLTVTATYAYTHNGLRGSATDAKGNITEYLYDDFDRLKKLEYPHKQTPGAISATDYEEFEYDAASNLLWKRTRAGAWIYRAYDGLNREEARSNYTARTGGAITRTVTTKYDLAGNIEKIVRSADTFAPNSAQPEILYLYDTAGRRKEEQFKVTGGSTPVEAFVLTLDQLGNAKQIKWPGNDNFVIDYEYDELNRLESIKKGESTLASYQYLTTQIAGYEHQKARRAIVTYGNGRTAVVDLTPDGATQSIKHTGLLDNNGTPLDATWAFSYSPANLMKNRIAPADFRWTKSTPDHIAYLSNGLNQYTEVKDAEPQYDNNGNLINDDAGWTYTYDAENRLVEADHPTAIGETPVTNAKYAYDGLDRRYSKDVIRNGSLSTRYLWLDDNILAEINTSNGHLLRRYVHADGVDEPIAMFEYAYDGETRTLAGQQYYHADHLGTVVAMSDGLTGSATYGRLKDKYKYTAFGESDPSSSGNIFRYTGRQIDHETGLYYYRARIYSPALGRFMQPDPVGDVDSINLYQYALWDPLVNKDPSGETTWCIGHYVNGTLVGISRPCWSDDGLHGLMVHGAALTALTAYNAVKGINSAPAVSQPSGETAGSPQFDPDDDDSEYTYDGKKVEFGSNTNQNYHTFRHTDSIGLNREDVKFAVREAIENSNIQPGHNNVIVQLNGKKLEATAFLRPNGVINVGSIKPL